MKALVSEDPRRVGVEVGSGVDGVQAGQYVVLDPAMVDAGA